jgi:hypothetical protein
MLGVRDQWQRAENETRQMDRLIALPELRSRYARPCPMEVTMDRFIHQQKLENYRQLIGECENAVTKNEIQHRWLIKLLAEEEAKDIKPPERRL